MSDDRNTALHETDTATIPVERRRRAGGRGAERSRKPSGAKYLNLVNNLARTELLSPEALDDIHEASLTILEEIGMDIILPEARERMRAAGAVITPGTERVRFDRGVITELIASVPSTFTLHARNPLRNVQIGGRNLVFAQVASAPLSLIVKVAGGPAIRRTSAS